MNTEEFKKEWQSIKTPQVDLDRLREMTMEKTHPVLSGIRRQLTIELIGWSTFLVICFTGLDADQKTVFTNIILLISVTLPMACNLHGYKLSKNIIAGSDITSSLQNRIGAFKRYAVASVVLRITLIIGVDYFFVSSININEGRIMLLAAGAVFLTFPIYILVRIWTKRIGILSEILRLLKTIA